MSKKKVAILTIINSNRNPNWGSKLQNYALQTTLESMGCEVRTINDARLGYNTIGWIDNWKNIVHWLTRFRYVPFKHGKTVKCFLWIRKHLKYTKEVIRKDEDFKALVSQYDYFIVGSDQIWNPLFDWYSNAGAFLQWARPEQRLTYAPSIGVTSFPKERMHEYKEWLSGFKLLSCREKVGAKILKEITGNEVKVVLDPTMLFTADEWCERAKICANEGGYILYYPLAEANEDLKNYVEDLSERKNKPIVQIKYAGNNDALDPYEFLEYVMNAEYVVTDSFHGTVFSMLFHKQITYMQSCDVMQNTLSRLQTLLDLAEITADFSKSIVEFPTINWDVYERNLAMQREKSLGYLKSIIK